MLWARLSQSNICSRDIPMRLKIRHETQYTYAKPVSSAVQILRLTPRSHDSQFVRRWRIEIDADCRMDRGEDAFGNITHTFTVDGPAGQIRIVADGEIDTGEAAGILRGTVERFPLGLWLRETALTRAEPPLRDYARQIASGEGGDKLATLHALVAAIHRDMTFTVDATDTQTTAAEAFKQRSGVCQDLAHVFIVCARSLGIPARYAGGYFLRTDTEHQEAGHAWAEAHINGLGWIGFDPTHGVCTTARYARVAIGQDYLDAAPVRGTRFGGAGESMSVNLLVRQGRELVEG
jgi:transglutaminase-like putative cysteine protease